MCEGSKRVSTKGRLGGWCEEGMIKWGSRRVWIKEREGSRCGRREGNLRCPWSCVRANTGIPPCARIMEK